FIYGGGTDDASEKLYMEPPHNPKPSTGKRNVPEEIRPRWD
ncbi:MAG: hypothetical protein OD814_001827, partial [Candidatus Alkanophagales archaeon MCA70_species_1]|nr:hypothetical protein [Candidatus Alkanophaga volatiphilum]